MSTAEMMLSDRGLIDIAPSRTCAGASTLSGYADPLAKTMDRVQHAQSAIEHDVNPISVEATDLDAAEWIASALDTLGRLRDLAADWHSCGARPPSRDSISTATRMLQKLAAASIAPSSIGPSTDEGVCIAFQRGAKYAGIECFNTGEILAVLSDGKTAPIIWEVSRTSAPETIARISAFISG